jgi:hypothetical protein
VKPRSARVTQVQIRRAIRAAEASGLKVTGVEILPDGATRVLTAPAAEPPMTELQRWRAQRDAGRAAARP